MRPEPAAEYEADGPGPAGIWAGIALTVDTAARQAKRHYDSRQKMLQSLNRVQVTGPSLTEPGKVYDVPGTLGPQMGLLWDIRRLTLASADLAVPWTGVVYVYNGLPSPVTLADVFTAPASRFYTSRSFTLTHRERLTFLTSPDFTGAAVIGGMAVTVSQECLAEFLL